MMVSIDKETGITDIKELEVDNVLGTYYSDELTALKERAKPLVKAVNEARAAYLIAVFNVDKDNAADIKAVEAKETALAELKETKVGVLVASELVAINKAEKELAEEIEVQKEINVILAENRKESFMDAADKAFTAVEAYKPLLDELAKEYTETNSIRTEKVYANELKQYSTVYSYNAKATFVSLKDKIQPYWTNGSGEKRFGLQEWRGHRMIGYFHM